MWNDQLWCKYGTSFSTIQISWQSPKPWVSISYEPTDRPWTRSLKLWFVVYFLCQKYLLILIHSICVSTYDIRYFQRYNAFRTAGSKRCMSTQTPPSTFGKTVRRVVITLSLTGAGLYAMKILKDEKDRREVYFLNYIISFANALSQILVCYCRSDYRAKETTRYSYRWSLRIGRPE